MPTNETPSYHRANRRKFSMSFLTTDRQHPVTNVANQLNAFHRRRNANVFLDMHDLSQNRCN